MSRNKPPNHAVKMMYVFRAVPSGDEVRVRARTDGAAVNEARQLLQRRGVQFSRVERVWQEAKATTPDVSLATGRVRSLIKRDAVRRAV